ncbi:penicillin-binding protein [Leptospira langatensis]|uniref:Penicillin-binding protein n=1 Tax=Leptospira langatensis TaxID=2484983 RepID=A0A5F1ZTB3_9LEPT|nr:biosynthetic peptidoglycan transglycosylase [Leptospira langatensis]TGK02915.1 penicillin-binding protein [Leptospira langatensis]TGL41670.1 penicillin-binding protein [Leptospira langatensis]
MQDADHYFHRWISTGVRSVLVLCCIVLVYQQTFPEKRILFQENKLIYLPENLESVPLERDWVRLDELPPGSLEYLVEVEDSRFYRHQGYSLADIQSAIGQTILLFRKLRGASTIDQQLARTLFLSRDKTLTRKLREIRIAQSLDEELGKKGVLEYYINLVYWGRGLNGIYKSANYYFGKSPGDLELKEFKALVQILKKPDAYSRNEVRSLAEQY